jgi:hypothetical protein
MARNMGEIKIKSKLLKVNNRGEINGANMNSWDFYSPSHNISPLQPQETIDCSATLHRKF